MAYCTTAGMVGTRKGTPECEKHFLQALIVELAHKMRFTPPSNFFMSERQQYAALKNGHCDRGEVEPFIMVPVWVDVNGRAHFTVKHEGKLSRHTNEVVIGANRGIHGKVYLDYDPKFDIESLVSPSSVYDSSLIVDTFLFICFSLSKTTMEIFYLPPPTPS